MLNRVLIFSLFGSLFFPALADAAEPNTYIVKAGDTLSQIAQTYIGSPVYPNGNGSLKALIDLNPILRKSPAIYPGQILALSALNSAAATQKNSRRPASQAASKTPPESAASTGPLVRHQFCLSARYGITTITATDMASASVAKLFSKRDAGFSAGWKQEWSSSFSTKIEGSLRDIDFEPPTNSAKALLASHKTITGLEFEAGHAISNDLQLLYRFKYESRLFVRGANTSAVTVDAVPIPEAGAEIQYTLLKKGNTTLGLASSGAYIFSGSADSYSIRSGFAYAGGLLIGYGAAKSPSVSLGLGYQNRTQNTATVKLRESSVLGTLSFGFSIFEAGKE